MEHILCVLMPKTFEAVQHTEVGHRGQFIAVMKTTVVQLSLSLSTIWILMESIHHARLQPPTPGCSALCDFSVQHNENGVPFRRHDS